MYKIKSLTKSLWFLFMAVFVVLVFCSTSGAQISTVSTTTLPATTLPIIAPAQNWTALPPYNTLWPLWSSVLSPVNPMTGLPTPLVTSLTRSTILPVQPGLTWDPFISHPWLLYNTPMGMVYYDPITGINPWPANILMNQITGNPITLTLPPTYGTLPATPAWWLLQNVPSANWEYLTFYQTYNTIQPTISSLLTPTALLL